MSPETAQNLSPEQRLVAMFEEGGMGVMDGRAPAEARVPDVETGGRGQSRQEPSKPKAEAEKDEGPAGPGTEGIEGLKPGEPGDEDPEAREAAEDSGDESAESGDTNEEGSQEQEGIEAGVLAEVLGIGDEGIAVDEEGRPLFTVKVDGEDRTVPLPELLRGYSGQEVFTRKSQQLAEERQRFEQQRQQELQGFTTKAQVVDQVLAEHQEEVLSQYAKEDWDTLRKEHPEEFAARRTEYAELYQKIGQRREAVQGEVLQLHDRAQQEAFQTRQQTAVEEGKKLRSAVKEWDTDEKAIKGAQAVEQFLRESYGFTPEILANTLDHRAYLVAIDAMRWRLQHKQEPVTRQRVVKAPKVLKPGVPTSTGEKRRIKTAQVLKRHHEEQSVESAAEAFLARGFV